MTERTTRTDAPSDEALGSLVRDVAAGWTMPAVPVDVADWRSRVRRPGRRWVPALRRGTLVRAATGALVLTLVAAVGGTWLTSRGPLGLAPSGRGPAPTALPSGAPATAGSTSPSVRPSALPSGSASPSDSAIALPKLVVNGTLPSPSRLLVRAEGGYASVDLATGTLGPTETPGDWGSAVRATSDGGFLCVCLRGSDVVNEMPSRMSVSLVRYDATGRVVARQPVRELRGAPDPRDALLPDRPQHVAVQATIVDETTAVVGWATHAHPLWTRGLLAVDLASGRVTGEVTLPSLPDGDGDARAAAAAPAVVGTLGAGRLAIAAPWYRWSPATSPSADYSWATDAFGAAFAAGGLGSPTRLAGSDGCQDIERAGGLDGGAYWLACRTPAGSMALRRVAADRSILGDTPLETGGLGGNERGDTSVVARDGSALYSWNAATQVVTRTDLRTGEVSRSAGAAVVADPLAALGRWLVPVASAKLLLSPSIALSPDGSRIYALGVSAQFTTDPEAGSSGVFVFDAATLAQVAHWPAAADYTSIALTADGGSVYVAGSPRPDAGRWSQEASITVFDAASGAQRLVAGQLGGALLLFPSSVVP